MDPTTWTKLNFIVGSLALLLALYAIHDADKGPKYASFQSMTTQPVVRINGNPNSVAITYDSKTSGNMTTVNNAYPSSEIAIAEFGIYRVCFSAQCDCTNGTHVVEVFPVINGVSVPESNTRLRVDANTETCLTVEYFLKFQPNDILELRMVGDNTNNASNARIVSFASSAGIGGPAIPSIPSIILTIQRIDW
jgi:hypothetical protein